MCVVLYTGVRARCHCAPPLRFGLLRGKWHTISASMGSSLESVVSAKTSIFASCSLLMGTACFGNVESAPARAKDAPLLDRRQAEIDELGQVHS
jgi:hypothetical protein